MAKQIKIQFRDAAHTSGVLFLEQKRQQIVPISQLEPQQLKNYIKANLVGPDARLTKENQKNLLRYFKNSIEELTKFVENSEVKDSIDKPEAEA